MSTPAAPIITWPQQVEVTSRFVQPPSQLYVTRNDSLYVDVASRFVAAELRLRARMMLPDGQVVYLEFVVETGPTARLAVRRQFPLPEGFLLGASLWQEQQFSHRGMTYAVIGLAVGGFQANPRAHALTAGYPTVTEPLSWPGYTPEPSIGGRGNLEAIQGTTPAAGAEIVETVPTNARWIVHAVHAELTTSGVGSNRTVVLVLDNAFFDFLRLTGSTPHGLSSTRRYWWSAAPQVSSGGGDQNIPIPPGLELVGTYRVRTVTANFDAGDQWDSVTLLVEEWLEGRS